MTHPRRHHPLSKTLPLLAMTMLWLAGSTGAQTLSREKLRFEPLKRINAHGDEYNDVALSTDQRRLFIGTEKGDILIWNIAASRIERKLNQVKPVHHVVALANPRYVVAAGVEHFAPARNGIVRKWDVEAGAFEDLPGLGSDFVVTALAVERQAGLIAASSGDGRVIAWDAATNRQIAAWQIKETPIALAIIGRTVYVSTIDQKFFTEDDYSQEGTIRELKIAERPSAPQVFISTAGQMWASLKPSPDGRMIAATYYSPRRGERAALLDVAGKKELANFDSSASAWIDRQSLLLFNWLDPSQVVRIAADGSTSVALTLGRMDSNMSGGRPFDLSGQVALGDGSRAWSVYRKGAGFFEWDLKARAGKPLLKNPGGAYRISVLQQTGKDGLVLTGGGDGYVRLWNLAGLSLRREWRIAAEGAFVNNAELLPGGRRAIISTMPIVERGQPAAVDIILIDLETGTQKKLLTVDQAFARLSVVGEDFLYPSDKSLVLASSSTGATVKEMPVDAPFLRYAISANQRWAAVLDYAGLLYLFDITTGQRVATQKASIEGFAPLAISNDGRYVYAYDHEGRLTKWDAKAGQVKVIVLEKMEQVHSRSDYILLAENDTRLLVAGNHGDIAIFDATSAELLFYDRTSAAAVYVESAWVNGNRMIFTTDTGVMIDGVLRN